jgi:hypothetical protein
MNHVATVLWILDIAGFELRGVSPVQSLVYHLLVFETYGWRLPGSMIPHRSRRW